MSKFDWKRTLATVAPSLAVALGGPMAGVAVAMAGKALGIDDADEGAIAAAVASGDTNVLVKLKEVETDFKAKMKQLDVDIAKIDAEDRGSARDMAKVRGLGPQTLLAAVFVCGFVYVLILLFGAEKSIHADVMQPAMYLLGILSAGIIQIMNFFFGSSAGSKAKTDAMSNIVTEEMKRVK